MLINQIILTKTDTSIFVRGIDKTWSALTTIRSSFVDAIGEFGTIVMTFMTALVEICKNIEIVKNIASIITPSLNKKVYLEPRDCQ